MTNTALHRAAPSRSRYRSAASARRRHRMNTLVSEVRHGKERPNYVFGWVMFTTLLLCWAVIGGALWGLSIHSTSPAPTKPASVASLFGDTTFKVSSFPGLDPSILANLHSVTSFKENQK